MYQIKYSGEYQIKYGGVYHNTSFYEITDPDGNWIGDIYKDSHGVSFNPDEDKTKYSVQDLEAIIGFMKSLPESR